MAFPKGSTGQNQHLRALIIKELWGRPPQNLPKGFLAIGVLLGQINFPVIKPPAKPGIALYFSAKTTKRETSMLVAMVGQRISWLAPFL